MAGYHRIPVPKKVYSLVKYYSTQSNLSIGVITDLLYRANINVYDKEKVFSIIEKYKKVRRIR